MNYHLLVACCISACLVACTSTTSSETSGNEADAKDTVVAAQLPTGPATSSFVMWHELAIRDGAGDKAKYLTTVYLGEQLKLTSDTASAKAGDKEYKYAKVTLSDGKSGWVRSDFIAVDRIPAAVSIEAPIYRRPDVASITAEIMASTTFVAARRVNENWYEVKARQQGNSWFTTAYLQANAITTDPIEIQYAIIRQRALNAKGDEQNVLYRQLEDQSVFGESRFYQEAHNIRDVTPLEYEFEEGDGGEGGEGIIAEEMVLLYFFDNSMMDETQRNHGIPTNATFAPDQYGNDASALHCNGSTFVTVDLTSQPRLMPPFSISAFYKTDDPTIPIQTIASLGRSANGTGFNFGYTVVDESPAVYFGFVGHTVVNVTAPVREAGSGWHHLAGTYDGKMVKLFFDGTLVGSTPVFQSDREQINLHLRTTTQKIEIGRELETLGRYFVGDIDALVIYNTAISDERAMDLKNGF